MQKTLLLCMAAYLLCSPTWASIIEQCEQESGVDQVQYAWDHTKKELIPSKYFDASRRIELSLSANAEDRFPFVNEKDGARLVVVPEMFLETACMLVFATYMLMDQKLEFPASALESAKSCSGSGKSSRAACVRSFAKALSESVDRINPGDTERFSQARSFLQAAFMQVLLHELAHHLLGHLKDVSTGRLSRGEAEFQADLFAMRIGVQAGHISSAGYYLFFPLSVFESVVGVHERGIYESALCRRENYSAFTEAVGLFPAILAYASNEEFDFANNTPPDLMAPIAEQLWARKEAEDCVAKSPHGCDSVNIQELEDLACEVKTLSPLTIRRFDRHLTSPGAIDEDAELAYVRDLIEFIANFEYVDGFASRLIARSIRSLNFEGRSPTDEVSNELERLAKDAAVFGQLLSADRARILLIVGLNVSQHRTDIPFEERLARGEDLLKEAVYYNEDLSEAWTNLAQISLRKGACESALTQLARAFMTSTEERMKGHLAAIFSHLKEYLDGGGNCSDSPLSRHPFYPGW